MQLASALPRPGRIGQKRPEEVQLPTQISNDRTFYDPYPDTCRADNADSHTEVRTPPVSAPSTQPSAQTITLDPVLVEGDLGAQALIKQYDQAQRDPNCEAERASAGVICQNSVISALAAASTGPWLGGALAFSTGVVCGKELAALYDCERQ